MLTQAQFFKNNPLFPATSCFKLDGRNKDDRARLIDCVPVFVERKAKRKTVIYYAEKSFVKMYLKFHKRKNL